MALTGGGCTLPKLGGRQLSQGLTDLSHAHTVTWFANCVKCFKVKRFDVKSSLLTYLGKPTGGRSWLSH